MGSGSFLLSTSLHPSSLNNCVICRLKLQHQMQSRHSYRDCLTSSGQIPVINLLLYVVVICRYAHGQSDEKFELHNMYISKLKEGHAFCLLVSLFM